MYCIWKFQHRSSLKFLIKFHALGYNLRRHAVPLGFPERLITKCSWTKSDCIIKGPGHVLVKLPNLALELRNSLEVSFCIGQISIERDELHSTDVVRSSAANSCRGRQTGSIHTYAIYPWVLLSVLIRCMQYTGTIFYIVDLLSVSFCDKLTDRATYR